MEHGSFDEDMSKSLTDAIIAQATSVEMRVQFAVEWDDGKRLQRELGTVPTWSMQRSKVLKDALQLALELEATRCVSVCIENAAPIKDIDLLVLYDKLYDSAKPSRFNMFAGELPTIRRARELGDTASVEARVASTGLPGTPSRSPLRNTSRKFRGISLKTATVRSPGSDEGGALAAVGSSGDFQPLVEEAPLEVSDSQIEDAIRDFYPVEVRMRTPPHV